MKAKIIAISVLALFVLAISFGETFSAQGRPEGPEEDKLLRSESKKRGPDLFKPPVNYAGVPYFIEDIFTTDLDNDGDSDLAVANSWYKKPDYSVVTIFKNRGDGGFDTTASYYAPHCAWSLSAADYDQDEDTDLAVTTYYPCAYNSVSILKNDGTGAFSYPYSYDVDSPEAVFSADFDKDGDFDLAVSLRVRDSVAVLLNDGYGWFDPAVYYYTGGHLRSRLFAADLNGDTCVDLAISNQQGCNLSILINNRYGEFPQALCYTLGNYPRSICGADLDKDGHCDLAIANEGQSDPHIDPSISIFKNYGDGTFYLYNDYVLTLTPIDIVTADFDLDGNFDLAFTSFAGSVHIWLNSGYGAFEPAETHFLDDYGPLVASDLNGDGAPDLAVGRRNSNDVAILINCFGSEPVPILTEWGVIILVGLITASALFMLIRRRKTTLSCSSF